MGSNLEDGKLINNGDINNQLNKLNGDGKIKKNLDKNKPNEIFI